MKRNIPLIILVMLFLLSYQFIDSSLSYGFDINYGQTDDDSGFPGEYLTTFAGNVRALGMGKAYNALSYDASGGYWNPSGLASTKTKEASFLYARMYLGGWYSFVGYVHPFTLRDTLGISWINLGLDDLEKTNEFGESQGTFSDTESCYLISYGRRLLSNLDVGVNLKLVTHDMDIYSALGYGIDLGMMYRVKPQSEDPVRRSILEGFSFGLTLQNVLQPRLKLKDETDTFPINLKTGVAWEILQDKLLWALDVNMMNLIPEKGLYEDGSVKRPVRWHTGAEYNFLKMFSVRAGIDYKEISVGLGVNRRGFQFDYACGANSLDITHRFGLALKFGMLPTAEELEIARKRKSLEMDVNYQQGLKLFNEKEYERAHEELEKVFAINPKHRKARELNNQLDVALKRDKARKHIEQALLLFAENKGEEAQQEMKNAEDLDPEAKTRLEKEYFKKAQELLEGKEYKKAKQKLVDLLYINPNNKKALELLRKLTEMLRIIER